MGGRPRSSALRSTNRVCEEADPPMHRPAASRRRPSTTCAPPPTEVGVPGGVDNIDEMIAIPNGCVLGQDGDAPFAFEVDVVHHAFCDLLMCAERTTLPQECINEGGLAVIDMSDDCNVAPQRFAMWRVLMWTDTVSSIAIDSSIRSSPIASPGGSS